VTAGGHVVDCGLDKERGVSLRPSFFLHVSTSCIETTYPAATSGSILFNCDPF
jgi:hypothetical protein